MYNKEGEWGLKQRWWATNRSVVHSAPPVTTLSADFFFSLDSFTAAVLLITRRMKREQDFSFCKQNNQNNSDHYDKSSALFETVPKRESLKTLHTFNETSGRFPAVCVHRTKISEPKHDVLLILTLTKPNSMIMQMLQHKTDNWNVSTHPWSLITFTRVVKYSDVFRLNVKQTASPVLFKGDQLI